ncbi:MAG: DUF3891 family protein [Solirubrobacteraceae bacterium]
MLVRLDGDGALAIGQLSHAWLAGQLAAAWGNARFGEVNPREEITLGVQQHDIGWAPFDLQPQFNPDTGLPRNFLELTVEEHLAIWRGAPDCLMSQSSYAALVVSLHSSSLSELRARSAPEQAMVLKAHINEELARQSQLCATLKVSERQKERLRRHIWVWDTLSLALCNAWRPFAIGDVPTADGPISVELSDRDDGTSTLDPWPFNSEQVEVCCEARRLGVRYEDEAALRRAFAQAEPIKLTFTFSPP